LSTLAIGIDFGTTNELFAVERLHLKPLPAWIPEIYRLQQRLVDIEGYVALNSNRYSVPVDWIGRHVEVRETKDKIEIQLDARRLVTHRRIAEAEHGFQAVGLLAGEDFIDVEQDFHPALDLGHPENIGSRDIRTKIRRVFDIARGHRDHLGDFVHHDSHQAPAMIAAELAALVQ
jgi:hypothetical protein